MDSASFMTLCHEGSDYAGFINNEARREYDQILLSAYEWTSPLRAGYRPTENSTVEDDLENIAEYSDDDLGYVEQHHPLPKSLGGTDKCRRAYQFVTVQLTFQEHFRVHQLLIDFTEGDDRWKMLYALSQMRRGKARKKILTPEQYAIARQANREAGHTAEAREKISAAHRGKTLTPEHRAKMSSSHRGKPKTPAHRAALSAALVGRTYTPGRRAAISVSRLGKPLSPSHRAALSAAQRGKTLSPSHRAAISRGITRYYKPGYVVEAINS